MAGQFPYSIMVVANGASVSSQVLDWLEARSDVRVVRLRSGSHPLARRVGAELADSEFLAFLDDDDELLPGTLAEKLDYFRENPEVDVLVTDGFRVHAGTTTRILPATSDRGSDVIEAMMRASWGAAAMTLRRSVDLQAFDAELRHMEWTFTALALARRFRVGFLDRPTYRYYEDTQNSLSKSDAHAVAAPEVWRRLVACYAGTRYETQMRRRHARECHYASRAYLRQGQLLNAWKMHAKSMGSADAVSFVRFTARLLLATLTRI
jgi:glycosyltransferase involved in cell wall biosynthesis